MKQACVAEVSKMLGRELTKAEQDTIEGHFSAAAKQFIAEDRAGFQAMSPAQRTTEIATRAQKLAMQSVIERSDALVHQAMVENSNIAMLDRVADKTKAVSFVRDLINQNAGSKAGVTSLETLAKATHYNAMRRLQGLLNMDGGKFFGLMANPERRAAALRAASGDATNDPVANAVGKAVADVNKELIAQAKAAGVSIHENPLWHRPQVDDVTKIRATPIGTWVSEVSSLVDREVMLDGTGRPNTPEALDKYLREIYETKAMDGVNKRAAGAGQSGVGASRVGSLNKERQLYFKDTDSYLSYMDKYADYQTAGEMFDAHYKRMSMDIALAQKFGANAPAHIENLLDLAHDAALRATGTDVKAAGKIDKEVAIARREVANLLTPHAPADSRVAVAMTTARNLSGAALLGNGVLSALPDAATLKIMAQLTEIPQARLYKSFFKASLTKKDDLTAHGIFLAAATEHLGRWGVETLGSKATHVTSWLNNAVQGASGLHLWDKMGRAAWSEGIMWKVGEVTRTMTDVAEFNKNAVFAQQGVTQHIFDIWRAADLSESPINKSDRMLTPDAIYSIPDAKLRPLIEQRVSERSQIYADEIAKRDAAVQKLQGWADSRKDQHAKLTEDLSKRLDEYIGRTEGKKSEQVSRVEALREYAAALKDLADTHVSEGRSASLGAQADAAQANAARGKAEARVAQAQKELRKVENGVVKAVGSKVDEISEKLSKLAVDAKEGRAQLTAKEAEFIHKQDLYLQQYQEHAQAIREHADAVTQAAKEANAAARAAVRGNYGEVKDAVVRAERAQAAVKVAEARLQRDSKAMGSEISAKSDEAARRVEKSLAALKEYTENTNARIAKHKEFLLAYQEGAGKIVDQELLSARSDAAIKLLSLAYDTEQSAFRGAMGANNRQRTATPFSEADPNTFFGQLGKCFMQFKSVPLGIFRTQFLEVPRMLEGSKGPLGMSAAAWHRAKFVVYATLLGGLSEQLMSVARGEQMKDMTDPLFPLLALARGGGLGFYADTFKASFDAKGAGDVLSQFSGPVPNAAARMLAEFGKAAKDNAEGKGKTSDVYAQHGLKWARQNVAVGANVFWWKAAFNRMIYDQAQDYFVPGTSQEQEKRSNARGTEYWWSPGHKAPDKDIDLSRAFGEGN
ncbi:structural protein [uncultured Caudovirales phage]|uniref:Structural protein n=1 Tax=uncultured Caudovirales phage TaxID=2100421 RepID=A0A6J7WCQ6_9CAUD|nr:structural protein [uncultured Caudovirales phage]